MSLLPPKVTLMSVSTSKKRTYPISGQNLFPQWCLLIRDYTVLVFSFMGFLRFSELSKLKHGDFILHNTYMSIFIERSKTDIYRRGYWFHSAKCNSNLCPLDLTKRYFVQPGQINNVISIFLEVLKTLKMARSYTTVRGHVLNLLANIGLDPKKSGLHSL